MVKSGKITKKNVKKTQSQSKAQIESKIEINDLLSSLDERNVKFFLNLTEKQKKSIPLQEVVLRFLSAVGISKIDFNEAKRLGRVKGDGKGPWPATVVDTSFTEHYLILTNEINKIIGNHELDKHLELLWKIFCIVGCGLKQEHAWLPVKKNKTDTPTIDYIIKNKFPLCSKKEIDLVKKQTSNEEFIEMVKAFGNPTKLSAKESKENRIMQGGQHISLDEETVYKELKTLGK